MRKVDVLSLDKKIEQTVNRQLLLKQLQIDSLLEVTKSISRNRSSEELFKIYEFILRAQMGVKKLLVFHNNSKEWTCACCYGVDGKNIGQIDVPHHLLKYKKQATLGPGKPAYFADFDYIIPVYHKDEPLAFVLTGDFDETNRVSSMKEKITFIETISNIVSVAIENKRLFKRQIEQENLEKELTIAAGVQNMLIPKHLPQTDELEMDAVYQPHSSIGGDYYDYIRLNKNEFLVCMADVSGKGISAALLMANVQGVLRNLARETGSLTEFVNKLNSRILDITQGERFITLFVAKHHLKTREMSYVNAGHNPPLLVHNKNVKQLTKGCTILGHFDKLPQITEGKITLQPNSMLITYTDGLTDLEDGKGLYFNIERLEQFAKQHHHFGVKAFNQTLMHKLQAFSSEHYTDDISLLSYRIF